MRYIISFFITLFLYSSLISTLFYNLDNTFIENKNLSQKQELIKISLVEEIEKKVEKKQEHKKIKKIEKPKKIKKEKPIVKKQKYKKLEQVVEKTPIIEKTKEIQELKKVENKIQETIDIKKVKNEFIEKLKKKIDKNKFYPKSARRRGIEGDVNVEFFIHKDGSIDNLKIKEGKTIFHKAVKESIKNSFPMKIDNNSISFPFKIMVKLKFALNN